MSIPLVRTSIRCTSIARAARVWLTDWEDLQEQRQSVSGTLIVLSCQRETTFRAQNQVSRTVRANADHSLPSPACACHSAATACRADKGAKPSDTHDPLLSRRQLCTETALDDLTL